MLILRCLLVLNWLQDAANLATVAGALGILFAVLSVHFARNTFHQGVIASCTSRFQELVSELANPDPATLLKYLELCNEELFYFEAGYLPQPVVDEWVDGMLGFIGFWRNGQPLALLDLQPASHLTTDLQNQLRHYLRLRYAFEADAAAEQRILAARQWDTADAQEATAVRAQAIVEVLRNLRRYNKKPFYCHLRRARKWRVF